MRNLRLDIFAFAAALLTGGVQASSVAAAPFAPDAAGNVASLPTGFGSMTSICHTSWRHSERAGSERNEIARRVRNYSPGFCRWHPRWHRRRLARNGLTWSGPHGAGADGALEDDRPRSRLDGSRRDRRLRSFQWQYA